MKKYILVFSLFLLPLWGGRVGLSSPSERGPGGVPNKNESPRIPAKAFH